VAQGVIYSRELRAYVAAVLRSHRGRGFEGQRSEAELIESYLRSQGVTVVDDVDKDRAVR
jgi:hypothetical protein